MNAGWVTDDDRLMKRWLTLANPPEILPLGDTREHEPGECCWCEPTLSLHGVLVHDSLDQRERGERLPS